MDYKFYQYLKVMLILLEFILRMRKIVKSFKSTLLVEIKLNDTFITITSIYVARKNFDCPFLQSK